MGARARLRPSRPRGDQLGHQPSLADRDRPEKTSEVEVRFIAEGPAARASSSSIATSIDTSTAGRACARASTPATAGRCTCAGTQSSWRPDRPGARAPPRTRPRAPTAHGLVEAEVADALDVALVDGASAPEELHHEPQLRGRHAPDAGIRRAPRRARAKRRPSSPRSYASTGIAGPGARGLVGPAVAARRDYDVPEDRDQQAEREHELHEHPHAGAAVLDEQLLGAHEVVDVRRDRQQRQRGEQ